MNETIEWLQSHAASLNEDMQQTAELRQASLTKPPGALGRIETVAIRLAAMQAVEQPAVERINIVVFAADHGVAAEGVSAFPQEVTAEMLKNFARGGAAINVLSRELNAELEVINLGTVSDPGPLNGVVNLKLGSGTANFCIQAAMHEEQLARALNAGREAVVRAKLANTELFIGGEMGIANTTAAASLACAILNISPEKLAGPGTGLDTKGVVHKIEIIRQALDFHIAYLASPLEILQRLGGFEIAALTGSYITCAQMGMPVLIDGFISSVAALVAARLCANAEVWFLFSHTSGEPGHQIVLDALKAKPLLNLGMRLGEGSGSAIAVPLLRFACALHNQMATFTEANVSEKTV